MNRIFNYLKSKFKCEEDYHINELINIGEKLLQIHPDNYDNLMKIYEDIGYSLTDKNKKEFVLLTKMKEKEFDRLWADIVLELLPKEFIPLSQVQEIIDFSRKEVLDEIKEELHSQINESGIKEILKRLEKKIEVIKC